MALTQESKICNVYYIQRKSNQQEKNFIFIKAFDYVFMNPISTIIYLLYINILFIYIYIYIEIYIYTEIYMYL